MLKSVLWMDLRRPAVSVWFGMFLALGALVGCGGGTGGSSDNAADPWFSLEGSTPQSAAVGAVEPGQGTVAERAEKQTRALLLEGARMNALELELARTPIFANASSSLASASRKNTMLTPVYRFYNRQSTAHFYTTSAAERDSIVADLPQFSLDGVAFQAGSQPDAALSPVHRFYNTQTGVHFYTISATEKEHVQATLPQFRYEGVAYYASRVPVVGAQALHRFFYASKGFHFYTTRPEEVRQLPQYIAEGVGYYVLGTGAADVVPLTVRVQGLAIGGVLGLSQGGASMRVDLNGDHVFPTQLPGGSALGSLVSEQPQGQFCALASSAAVAVPADGSPVFVRCVTSSASRVVMPATLPNNPLVVDYGLREVAYPGIPYESRPGVVGGQFPYEYRLKSLTRNGVAQSTAAVSLDFRRGVLRFTPETEGTYVVTLDIRDSGTIQQNVERSFAIQALASRFKFVSPSGLDAVNGGAIVAPLKSLTYALSHSSPDQVIILRRGTHVSQGFTLNDAHAKQVLAYPNEVATLDFNHAGGITVNSNTAPMARLEGVDVTRIKQYGVVSDPSKAGLVVRQVNFRDGEEGSTPRENPAYIHGWGDTFPASRHRMLIQENWFGPYMMKSSGAYALTLFDAGHTLIENNQMLMGRTSGGIHDKDNSQNNTHRENYMAFSEADAVQGGIQVSAQANAENVHIHHNLMINAGIFLGIQCFQDTCYMKNHDVHHNTLVGSPLAMNWGPFQPASEGTRLRFNIIQSGTQAPYTGLSCQPRPSGLSTQMSAGNNLLISSSALAFKDSECTGNDLSWAEWQNTYGFDTLASNSTRTSNSVLVGNGPRTGLPQGDPRILEFGHQY